MAKPRRELRSDLIAIKKYSEIQPHAFQTRGGNKRVPLPPQPSRNVGRRGMEIEFVNSRQLTIDVAPYSSNGESETTYHVNIRLVCGGAHTAVFRYGNGEITHAFTVHGQPQRGQRVRTGPDWTEGQPQNPATREAGYIMKTPCYDEGLYYDKDVYHGQYMHSEDGIGRVKRCNPGPEVNPFGQQGGMMVAVLTDTGNHFDYKWGIDGEYEIELC